MRSICNLVLVIACVAASDAVQAAEEDIDWTIDPASLATWVFTAEAGVDDESNADLTVGINFRIGEKTWGYVEAGLLHSPDTVADLDSRNVQIGVDHAFGAVSVEAAIDYWGDPGNLERRGATFMPSFVAGNTIIGIPLVFRDYDITARVRNGMGDVIGDRVFDVDSEGYGIDISIPAGNADISVFGTWYDFSRDVTVLDRPVALVLLSASSLTLVNSFIDHNIGADIMLPLGTGDFSISVSQDRSAINGERAENLGLSYAWPVGGAVDLEVGAGFRDVVDLGTTSYLTLGLSWFGL